MTAIIALLLSNCKSIQLESRWLDRPLSYAGKVSEWNDCIVYPNDTKFGIGVKNDDKFLYVCMTSWDANVSAQIIRMGFTAMFELEMSVDHGEVGERKIRPRKPSRGTDSIYVLVVI
jgi:hypothetical protein